MSRLTRDGTAELVSRDQILRREWGQGTIHFPCSADHEQDWQPYPDEMVQWYYLILRKSNIPKKNKKRNSQSVTPVIVIMYLLSLSQRKLWWSCIYICIIYYLHQESDCMCVCVCVCVSLSQKTVVVMYLYLYHILIIFAPGIRLHRY